VLSDHGEEFKDHGRTGHGKSLYREVIHVPFIFRHPALAPRRVAESVGTIDLLPTLAELSGAPANPVWQGRSLAAALQGAAAPPDAPLFSQLLRAPEYKRRSVRAAVSGSWHYIATQPKKEGAPAKEELFDLAGDFRERDNKAGASPKIAAGLKSSLDKLDDNAAHVSREEVRIPVDDDTLKELKSLGYVN
jgi:choline-sulfatase